MSNYAFRSSDNVLQGRIRAPPACPPYLHWLCPHTCHLMNSDGYFTSKFCVSRKMGAGGRGNKGEKNFLYYVFAILFWTGSPSKWLLPTSHWPSAATRGQRSSLYLLQLLWQNLEMGEVKAENYQPSISDFRINVCYIIISVYFLKSSEHILS